MRKFNRFYRGNLLKVNDSYEAVTIEEKIARVIQNNEPIDETAPIIYTERKDGVQAGYNVRTDRWDVAIDAMDAVSKERIAKREEYLKVEKGGAETAANPSDTEPKAS